MIGAIAGTFYGGAPQPIRQKVFAILEECLGKVIGEFRQ